MQGTSDFRALNLGDIAVAYRVLEHVRMPRHISLPLSLIPNASSTRTMSSYGPGKECHRV